MTNQAIYDAFEKQHSYSFSTIDDGYPEIRIAHFNTYDDDGLYFMTMKIKPFYHQLITSKTVAVCSLVANEGAASHDENGLPGFPPGYFIRVSGDVRELTAEELNEKANKNPRFIPLVKDAERYPAMTAFVLYKFKGEVFDYDFEKQTRDYKIHRTRFTFGGMSQEKAGLTIDPEKCIACGACEKVCTFSAIIPGPQYQINPTRCDECGDCYITCPVNAIVTKSPLDESERQKLGKQLHTYNQTLKNAQ